MGSLSSTWRNFEANSISSLGISTERPSDHVTAGAVKSAAGYRSSSNFAAQNSPSPLPRGIPHERAGLVAGLSPKAKIPAVHSAGTSLPAEHVKQEKELPISGRPSIASPSLLTYPRGTTSASKLALDRSKEVTREIRVESASNLISGQDTLAEQFSSLNAPSSRFAERVGQDVSRPQSLSNASIKLDVQSHRDQVDAPADGLRNSTNQILSGGSAQLSSSIPASDPKPNAAQM